MPEENSLSFPQNAGLLSPRRWDVVFTCYEPLVKVTGGIGSYHKLLLQELDAQGLSILVLTRSANRGLKIGNVEFVFVGDHVPSVPYNFVGAEHEFFSLHCHFTFKALWDAGHRFGFVEFSDYGADGYYPLRAQACGTYNFDHTAVRLHSPNVMLVEDNGSSHADQTPFVRDQIDREMSVYDDCDTILFGGDAMRDRVLELTERFGLDVRDKCSKCPHPFPRHLFEQAEAADHDQDLKTLVKTITATNPNVTQAGLSGVTYVGIFGRIEDRKGQYQTLYALLNDPQFLDFMSQSQVHFVIAGHNVLESGGNYRLSDLYNLIHHRKLADRFHFTGRVDQGTLAAFSRVVRGYIFPSVFENYPNALLEVLPSTKPVCISVHGCMPEITDGFTNVTVFDPAAGKTSEIVDFLQSLQGVDDRVDLDERQRRIDSLEERQKAMVACYCEGFPAVERPAARSLRVGFVVPIYREHRYLDEALASIVASAEPDDRIVVVDDCSPSEEASVIRSIVAGYDGVEYLALTENSGPAAARLAGVRHLETDVVQFCDGDDLLEPDGIRGSRHAMGCDAELTMVVGVMYSFQDANHCWVPRNGHIWTAVYDNFAHSGSMIRRDVAETALASITERLPINEDWLSNLLVLSDGGKCRMSPDICYRYRRFKGTRSTKNQEEHFEVRQQIVRKALGIAKFVSPEQNARLRVLLQKGVELSLGIPQGALSPRVPLRYRLADRLFFGVKKLPFGNRTMLMVYHAIQRRSLRRVK